MNEDALRRIEQRLGPDVIDRIVALPGADLTTVMLEVARRRAAALEPADVLRRYETDRFVRPGAIAPAAIARIEAALFDALPEGFEPVELAPVVPLGAHGLAGVDQSRVVTTVRMSE